MLEFSTFLIIFINALCIGWIHKITFVPGGLFSNVAKFGYEHNLKFLYCNMCFAGWVALISSLVFGFFLFAIPACAVAMYIFKE